MKNTLSYTIGVWVSGLLGAAVWGWGGDLHASLSFQTFCALSLPAMLVHLGITSGYRRFTEQKNAANQPPATAQVPTAAPAAPVATVTVAAASDPAAPAAPAPTA